MIKSRFIEPTPWDKYGKCLQKTLNEIQNNEQGIIVDFTQEKETMPELDGRMKLFFTATILYEVKSKDNDYEYSGIYGYNNIIGPAIG